MAKNKILHIRYVCGLLADSHSACCVDSLVLYMQGSIARWTNVVALTLDVVYQCITGEVLSIVSVCSDVMALG